MTTTPVVHRRSALEAFACPRRYKALYIDQVPDASDPARRGSAFHAAAHRYIAALVRTKQSADFELARVALLEGMASEITPAHLVAEVTDLFWRWAEKFELDRDAFLTVETRQTDDEGYTWQPDLVYAFDEVLEIRDWKTNFQIFTETRAAEEFQALWYCWQARKLWPGFQRYRIVFVFVRYGVEVAAEFDLASIDQFEAQVEAVVASIRRAAETDMWPAVPGSSCSYCSLRCEVADHPERVPVRLVSQEQAQRALQVKLAMASTLRTIDSALSAWCAANGPLTVNGMEIAHRPTARLEFPAAGVFKVLSDNDITPKFAIGATALKSYLTAKKYAHVRDDIAALALARLGNRFSVKRAGDVDTDSDTEE